MRNHAEETSRLASVGRALWRIVTGTADEEEAFCDEDVSIRYVPDRSPKK